MILRRLVYLGRREEPGQGSEEPALRCEGQPLTPQLRVDLVRRRSPWSPSRPVERILLGTHADRADLLLEGAGLVADHARLYVSKEDPTVNDLKVPQPDTVWVNGTAVGPHDWYDLQPGDELHLGPWRFLFEVAE